MIIKVTNFRCRHTLSALQGMEMELMGEWPMAKYILEAEVSPRIPLYIQQFEQEVNFRPLLSVVESETDSNVGLLTPRAESGTESGVGSLTPRSNSGTEENILLFKNEPDPGAGSNSQSSMPRVESGAESTDSKTVYLDEQELIELNPQVEKRKGMGLIGHVATWPSAEEFGMDESQYTAFCAALTQEISIIQGPPGKNPEKVQKCKCVLVIYEDYRSISVHLLNYTLCKYP